MVRLSQSDLEQVLAFVRGSDGFADVAAFGAGILPGLQRLVPCDSLAYNLVDPVRREVDWIIRPAELERVVDPIAFNRNVHQHPLVAYTSRFRDGRAVQMSDFLTRRQFHALELYDEFFRPHAIEHQMVTTLPAVPPNLIGLPLHRERRDFSERDRRVLELMRPHLTAAHRRVLARTRTAQVLAARDRGERGVARQVVLLDPRGRVQYASRLAERWLAAYFGPPGRGGRLPGQLVAELRGARATAGPEEALRAAAGPVTRRRSRERLMVELVPPARIGNATALLLEEQRDAPAPEALERLGLTRREAAVLALVAAGLTNTQIAVELSISPRTAQKHLERINAKLGVGTRTAAAAVAWRAGA